MLLFACAFLALSALVHAQQVDLAVGAGILISTKNTSASQTYLAPPEKGGIYPSVSVTRIRKSRLGYNAELAFRYKEGIYNNFQQFRPFIYDANAVFAPRLGKRIIGELMAGAGGQTVRFNEPPGGCPYASGCSTHLDSTHFLLHVGGGVQYRVWRNFFVRPEAHYYRILNNTDEFHSDNVLRVGASVGYTFHTE